MGHHPISLEGYENNKGMTWEWGVYFFLWRDSDTSNGNIIHSPIQIKQPWDVRDNSMFGSL